MTNFYCNNKVPRSLSSSFFLSLSLSHSQTHTDSRTQLIYSPVAGLNSLFLVHSLSLSFLPTQHPSLPLSYSFKNSISLPLSLSLSYSLVNISLLILDTGANTLTLSFSNPFLSHTISLPLSLSPSPLFSDIASREAYNDFSSRIQRACISSVRRLQSEVAFFIHI